VSNGRQDIGNNVPSWPVNWVPPPLPDLGHLVSEVKKLTESVDALTAAIESAVRAAVAQGGR
jgi:hypothetical protein